MTYERFVGEDILEPFDDLISLLSDMRRTRHVLPILQMISSEALPNQQSMFPQDVGLVCLRLPRI